MALVALAAAVTTVAACTVDASRSGAPRDVLAVRVGTPDSHGRPSTPIVEGFARELTKAGLTAEPDWPVTGTAVSDEEAAKRLARGDVEVAVVPARVWDLLGVDTLRPLQLPGLIATDAAAAAVTHDEVATTMLDGLLPTGVVGLALVPEGVRRIFVLPPHTPDKFSFEGARVRTLPSKASEEVFAALGATPVHADGDEFATAVADQKIDAVETSWSLVSTIPGRLEAVSNTALGVKFDVIAVNAKWFASRTDTERTAIRAAAESTAAAVIAETEPDATQAAAFCRAGGVIAPGPAGTTGTLTKARTTLTRKWSKDADSAAIIKRLEKTSATVEPTEPLAACTPPQHEPSAAPTGGPDVFPAGVYRMQVSMAELVNAGMNPMDANQHAGTWTITFRDGELDMGDGCTGMYRVVEGRVELHLGDQPACGTASNQVLFSARWETDSQSLRFLDLKSGENEPSADAFIQALFQNRPFTKIR